MPRVSDSKVKVSMPLYNLATLHTQWTHHPHAGKVTMAVGATGVVRGGLHVAGLLTASGQPLKPPPKVTWQYGASRVGRRCVWLCVVMHTHPAMAGG